jgi:hypothetical protein
MNFSIFWPWNFFWNIVFIYVKMQLKEFMARRAQ